MVLAGCGAGPSTRDAVAQDAATPATAPAVVPTPAAGVRSSGDGLNTCALDADEPDYDPGHGSDPNPDRPAPTRADPHYEELVTAPNNRRFVELERLQFSSPAFYLAHDIADKADHYDDVDNAGYADIRYDTGRDVVDLWWKGPLSAKVRRLVEAGPARNVKVKVYQADYGLGFFLNRMDRLHQDAELDAAGIHLNSWSPALGAAGIRVEIFCRGFGVNPAGGAALVRSVGERQTGLPVRTVVVGPESHFVED